MTKPEEVQEEIVAYYEKDVYYEKFYSIREKIDHR